MQTDENKRLTDKLSDFNREISILRNKLNEISSLKEKWFSEKEGLKKEISELIKHIKELREKKRPDKQKSSGA